MAIDIQERAVSPRDVSLTLTGSPQQLVPANPNRSHLQFQNIAGSIVYSYTNSLCAAGLTGCYTLGAGDTWSTGFGLIGTAVYVNGTAGQMVVASEC